VTNDKQVGLARTIYTFGVYTVVIQACVGLARTRHIQCICGVFGREIIKYTVIYGVYIRFWPTLQTGNACIPCG
jgi:hypothetical protein